MYLGKLEATTLRQAYCPCERYTRASSETVPVANQQVPVVTDSWPKVR